jgi:predicted transcriptional regulator
MSLFEIIISIAVCVYVLTSIYFSITGRIMNKKQNDFTEQVNVLTTRLGEIMTENYNLNNTIREWKKAYSDLQMRYNELDKMFNNYKKRSKKKEVVEHIGDK